MPGAYIYVFEKKKFKPQKCKTKFKGLNVSSEALKGMRYARSKNFYPQYYHYR